MSFHCSAQLGLTLPLFLNWAIVPIQFGPINEMTSIHVLSLTTRHRFTLVFHFVLGCMILIKSEMAKWFPGGTE